MTLKSSFRIIFLIILVFMVFLGIEFFYTSRMTLELKVIFPEQIDNNVEFNLKVYSGNYSREMRIRPENGSIQYENLPFDDYFFEIELDDRTIMKEFRSFQSDFSFVRKSETAELNLAELATITSVDYQLEDPYLSMKWSGKYLGAFRPAQYLLAVNGKEEKINVNYAEIDLMKELLSGEDKVSVQISPLTKDGKKILSYHFEVPAILSQAEIIIPYNEAEGRQYFNIYDMSINIQGKNIPIDPYDPVIEFPVISPESTIPYNIQYYGNTILLSQMTPSEDKQIILPSLPQATITSVTIDEATTTITLGITSDDEFMTESFTYFRIRNGTQTTVSKGEYVFENKGQTIEIMPFFMPDVYGNKLEFKVPSPPQLNIHTFMIDAEGNYSPEIKLHTDSESILNGEYSYDNDAARELSFKKETLLEYRFAENEIHNLKVTVEDGYGQKGSYSKWISSAMPETTFFNQCYIDENRILHVSWDELKYYDRIEALITDTYSIKYIDPVVSQLTFDLSGTAFLEPLKVIIRGFIGENQYTAAVFDGLTSRKEE